MTLKATFTYEMLETIMGFHNDNGLGVGFGLEIKNLKVDNNKRVIEFEILSNREGELKFEYQSPAKLQKRPTFER